ncbi:MAG: Histidine kinase, partial [Verrucomicrobiaceae bacterium]|nr:Histidine kinase [Verrucomicrobiaceae bacterium]
ASPSRACFELTFATQGQEALEIVHAAHLAGRPFAIAFMDVRMPPGWDGLETTLKLWEVTPDLHVVICTAYSDKSWEQMTENLPHPERLLILKKPFDGIEVLQLAHALTEKWSLLHAVRRNMEQLERTVLARTHELTTANGLLAAEVAMHERSQERVRELTSLLDKAQDAIVMTDANERIVYWNKGSERTYGWTEAEALGQNAMHLLFKDERPERIEARLKVMTHGEWTGELRHQTKDGNTILMESRWTMLYDTEGKPKARLGISTDITERRRLAAQILRMQRMESIGTLASGVAHDLNNALSPIILGLELLRMRLPDEPNASLIGTLDASAQRGREIVRQILTFASGVEGDHTVLSVENLISEQESICRNTFYKMIDIRTEVPAHLWPVQGDNTQLHQVLMNLCVNARDAMLLGGTLSISAANLVLDTASLPGSSHLDLAPGPYVLITVADTGTGIPAYIMERIFDPFFTTKGPGKGTGLGLSTVIGIVQQHGGFVDAVSEPGMGSQFKVYLPAMPASTPTPLPRPATRPPSGNHERILVIDDEQSIRDIIKSTLEIQGYDVVVADGGKEGLALFSSRPEDFALVITDMSMPVMDGPATIVALQKIKPAMRIILMSGVLEKARLAGTGPSVSFLQKPFTGDKLLTRLHEVLQERTGMPT